MSGRCRLSVLKLFLSTRPTRWSIRVENDRPGMGPCPPGGHRLVGLVVKASASRAEDPGFEARWRRDFSGVESYQ